MLLSSNLFQIYVLGGACSVHVVQKWVETRDAVSLQPPPALCWCVGQVCLQVSFLMFFLPSGRGQTGLHQMSSGDSAGTKPPSVPKWPSCWPYEHRPISEPRSSLCPQLVLTRAGWLKASLCPAIPRGAEATTPTRRHRPRSSGHAGHAGRRLLPEHNTARPRAPSAPRTRERARYEALG